MEAKEIKINETNFKFVQLTDYCKGSEHILIRSETKRKMYYQRIFFTDDTRNWTKSSCFEFISTVNFIGNCHIPAFIRNYLQTAWILVKEKGRRFENIEYDSEDIKLLLSFAGSSLFDYISLTESLLLATRCQSLIQTFYQAFGEERKNNFKTLLKILISRDEYKANRISAKHEQTRENAVTDTILVYRISPNRWQECLDCGTEQGILNPKEQSVISSLIKSLTTGRFVLSGAQIKVVIGAQEKLKEAKIFKDGMIQDDA